MLVPAGSPIFFLREHRFAVRCRIVTLRQLLWTLFSTLLFVLNTCLLHIFLYIFFINIGCATLYHLSMMYVTVYNVSFNSNCHILAAELNYRFTQGAPWKKKLDQNMLKNIIDISLFNFFALIIMIHKYYYLFTRPSIIVVC